MSLTEDLRGRDIVLDTNLTLLYLAGTLDPVTITRWKCTASLFCEEDFITLAACLKLAARRISTPHIMTEVSHFLEELDEGYRLPAFSGLSKFAEEIHERFTLSATLLKDKSASILGLSDAQQLHLSRVDKTICLLSVDAPLVDWTQRAGGAAINFNHLRFPQ